MSNSSKLSVGLFFMSPTNRKMLHCYCRGHCSSIAIVTPRRSFFSSDDNDQKKRKNAQNNPYYLYSTATLYYNYISVESVGSIIYRHCRIHRFLPSFMLEKVKKKSPTENYIHHAASCGSTKTFLIFSIYKAWLSDSEYLSDWTRRTYNKLFIKAIVSEYS